MYAFVAKSEKYSRTVFHMQISIYVLFQSNRQDLKVCHVFYLFCISSYLVILYHHIIDKTSIAAWIKNPFQRTSEHIIIVIIT